MSAWVWIAVAVVGGIGAMARSLLDRLVGARAGRGFPFGTLTVNATGSVALGLLSGLAVSGDALLIAGTAAIGSYTTFSTWMFQTQRLGEQGALRAAGLNVALSIALGVAGAALGRAIGAQL